MYSSSGLSTDVLFPNKTNINSQNHLGGYRVGGLYTVTVSEMLVPVRSAF